MLCGFMASCHTFGTDSHVVLFFFRLDFFIDVSQLTQTGAHNHVFFNVAEWKKICLCAKRQIAVITIFLLNSVKQSK